KLIVGLGNPGSEYDGTRHNVGFEVIDLLARRHNISVSKRSFKSVYGEGSIGGEKVLLMRPMTFMNLSGEAVGAIARFYKFEPTDIWVVLDEVALPPGRIRLRFKGSAGGHNGLSNILSMLHTQDVPRIRIGVGAAKPGAMVGHVLGKFRKEEYPLVEEAVARSADAIECALKEGFEMAMNRFNLPDKPPVEKPPKPDPS
ncbi:MAG: peptidyl-tRNA hydrolase, partial [Chthonomonadaceae bacterium]|nr:peptidyl-tRNA hydrolase [Chthonomonadaceae bacterium]